MNNRGNDRFCYGDTGGPLICDDTLVGLAHNTVKCENYTKNPVDLSECGLDSTVDTYVYLYNYLKWLNFVMKTKVMARTVDNEMNINEISFRELHAPSTGYLCEFGLSGSQLFLIIIVHVLLMC